MIQEKITRIQALLKTQNSDGLVLGNFGFNITDTLLYWLLLQKTEYAFLYVPRTGRATLFCISFETAHFKKKFPGLNVREFAKPENMYRVLAGKYVLYNAGALPISAHIHIKKYAKKLRPLPAGHTLFCCKLPQEITRLKKAAKITDTIFQDTIGAWKTFKTETDVATHILRKTLEHGVEPSFPPIVASGKHAALPHAHPRNKKIERGFCVIDMGVRFGGYCSDMTRTVFVGQTTKKDVELYELLLSAQEQAASAAQIGVRADALDKICRNVLGARLSKQFIHGLGHGVGSEVHEYPSLNAKSQTALEENMVFTIEPGVYVPGKYGLRIEDTVLLTKKGAMPLNKSLKKLIAL